MDEANWLVHEADDAINFYLSQMRDIRMDDISSTNDARTVSMDAQQSASPRIPIVSTNPQLDAQPSTSRRVPISPLIDEELSATFTGKTFYFFF